MKRNENTTKMKTTKKQGKRKKERRTRNLNRRGRKCEFVERTTREIGKEGMDDQTTREGGGTTKTNEMRIKTKHSAEETKRNGGEQAALPPDSRQEHRKDQTQESIECEGFSEEIGREVFESQREDEGNERGGNQGEEAKWTRRGRRRNSILNCSL